MDHKQYRHEYEKTAQVDSSHVHDAHKILLPEIQRLQSARTHQYATDYALINVPFDTAAYEEAQRIIQEKKALQPTMLIVIGIGGSYVGTRAIQEAVYGRYYNEQQPDITVYYAPTVDSDELFDIILLMKAELEKGHTVLLNVISKSGTTLETVANFELFLAVLKGYRPVDYKNYLIITTDEGSTLWHYAHQQGLTRLPIPAKVGGRYSVFTPVGLFPLGMIGINIEQLLRGAQEAVDQSLQQQLPANQAARNAILMYLNYTRGYTIHNLFLFSVDLEGIGHWYRQLMGESLGKKYNKHGALVHAGITPTVSIGTTDLHSVAQLYIGGPHNTYTTFVQVGKNKSNLVVPASTDDALDFSLADTSISSLMNAIFYGTLQTYYEDKRPFVTIALPEKSSFFVGEFLQRAMLEMVYLAYLMQVNPFDQPEVERYKEKTRKILADE